MDIIVTADLYYAVAAVLSDIALKLVGQHPEIAEAVSTHFTMRRRGRITDAVTEEAVAAFVRDFGTAVRVSYVQPTVRARVSFSQHNQSVRKGRSINSRRRM